MKYFTIQELCYSATAERYGIDNTPTDDIKQNLQALIEQVLDPIREKWGGPIVVSSGYRCTKLNSHPRIKGKPTSWHLKGLAADLQVKPKRGETLKSRIKQLFDQIVSNPDIPFERILFEHNSIGAVWIHIQFDPLTASPKRRVIADYFAG